jgi:hypothetical protein
MIMVPNFSVPLNGLQQACWDLDKIAQRIASPKQGARTNEDSSTVAGLTDPAADMILLAQVENTAEANLRVLSTHDEIAKNMLDILA